MLRITIVFLCVIASAAFTQTGARQQPAVTTDGTIVVFPEGYQKDKSYPALYLLPYTGGTAENLLAMWAGWQKEPPTDKVDRLLKTLYPVAGERQKKEFFVFIPPEVGVVDGDGSWDGFQITIDRWEKKIKKNLSEVIPDHGVDGKKVVVAGFSLGGDLSWALSLRNPDLFAGAIVMGSHLSYGWNLNWKTDPNINRLEKNGFRFVLTMGENEDDFRVEGFDEGKAALDKTKIRYLYRVVPGKAHAAASTDILKDALDYILFP